MSAAWDAEVEAGNDWVQPDGPGQAAASGGPAAVSGEMDEGSAAGSGYPETKDDGAGMGESERWQSGQVGLVPASEQAVTQGPASEPSAIILTGGREIGGSGAIAGGLSGAGEASAKATAGGTLNGRRQSMAFEIARVERAGKSSPPNILKARRVWELSRPRYVEERSNAVGERGGRRVRVPPGLERRDAVPYGVWGTSWAQMGDFGLDVGMYFVTIAQLIGAVLVYAALCIVAMVHFSSQQYSEGQEGVRSDLRGSAVCTSILSVFTYDESFSSRAAIDRNDCPLDAKQGYADMAGVLLLFLLLLVLGKAQDKAAEYTDAQLHSARAYTVKVSSPDPLADDPDRWRRLFAQFGHVSYVTVARGNGSLLRAMAERRVAGKVLEGSTSNTSEVVEAYKAVDRKARPSLGPGGWWKALFQPMGLFRDTMYWKRQLWAAHNRVECEVMQGMHDQGLPVVKVFVTFESDLSQARCLSHMSRGILDAPEEQHMYTNPDGFKESLHVMPASPAAEVVYENLHISRLQKAAAQILTFALTAAIVVLGYIVASKLVAVGLLPVALVITALDAALPSLVRVVCCLERHHNVVTHDLSVMNKLTLARWANLAGIPFVLNDRIETLSSDNLELVATVLWLNMFVPPILRLLDISGRWERNVLAPKEVVQSAIDSHFRGSRFYLSERYTDTTKTIFACLVYAPVFPLAMWLCLGSLVLSYWADKHLFMTAWRTPHPPGNSGRAAKLARRHLALAVLAHCVLALYYYSGWPFDHVCRFEGGWIECSQEGTGLVEAEPQQWMPGDQKTLVDVFSALNVCWLVILLVFYYLQNILAGISLVFKGAPRKLRSRQHMPFSQLTSRYQHEVDSYVPQISREEQPLPLLACDLDLLEPETIPWKVDGQKGDSFEDYCLSSARDLPRISRYQRARLFSLCVHYPPPAPFEGIANGRSSKNDMDWFRRPPPGLQETKIPEMANEGNMMAEGGNSGAMAAIPGLVDSEIVNRRPQSQANLHSNGGVSNGMLSMARTASTPRDGERELMMPEGAQSSLVSTTIVRANSAEAGGEVGDSSSRGGGGSGGGGEDDDRSAGTEQDCLGDEATGAHGQRLAGSDSKGVGSGLDAMGRGRGSGADPNGTGGREMRGAESRSFSMRSGISARSGRSGRVRTARIEHGDETSDICAGEGADEYAVRRRSEGRGGRTFTALGAARDAQNAAGGHGGVGATNGSGPVSVAAGGGSRDGMSGRRSSSGNEFPSELDGDLSYYEESHQHCDGDDVDVEEEDMNDLPTPVLAPPTASSGARHGGLGPRGGQGGSGDAEGSDGSDGWVDQYTNSSLGGSREDLNGVSQAQSVMSTQAEQWRKAHAHLTPAV